MASNKFRFATFYFFTWIALASEIDSGSKSPVAYLVYRSTFRGTIRQNVRAGMSHTESLATYPTCTQIIIHYDIINIEKSRFLYCFKNWERNLGKKSIVLREHAVIRWLPAEWITTLGMFGSGGVRICRDVSVHTYRIDKWYSGSALLLWKTTRMDSRSLYCMTRNVRPRLHLPISPLLSVGELKTRRIPMS